MSPTAPAQNSRGKRVKPKVRPTPEQFRAAYRINAVVDTAQGGTSVHKQRWDNAYLYLEVKGTLTQQAAFLLLNLLDNLDTSARVSTPQNTARTLDIITTTSRGPPKRRRLLIEDGEVDEGTSCGLASMDVDMDTNGCHYINKKPAASPSIELCQQDRAIPPPMVATSRHGDKRKAQHGNSRWSHMPVTPRTRSLSPPSCQREGCHCHA